jgi:hypothetical protein
VHERARQALKLRYCRESWLDREPDQAKYSCPTKLFRRLDYSMSSINCYPIRKHTTFKTFAAVQRTYLPQRSEQDRMVLVVAYHQAPYFDCSIVIMYIEQSF